jgi:tetratricopeptide (TPR) repeat protein
VEWALAHELVHVVAGRFGVPVLRANTSPGLVEGVAMALAPDAGERTYHQYAAAMRSQGIRPDLVSLMRPTGFVVQSSSVSYILAGSFCRYLLDRYGVRQLMTVYRTSDYEAAYGRTVEQLVDEWEGFLERLAPRPGDAELVDALFRRPPIFRKTCPRLAARAVAEGRAEFQRGDFPGAAERFADVYRTTGAYEAFSGWLFSLARQGRQDSVRALYTRIVEADTRPARYLSLGVLFGDAFWAGGDTAAAARLYRTVRRAALSDQLTEQAALRLRVLPDDSSGAWRMFFLSPPADSLRSVLLDSLRLDSVTPCAARYVRGQLAARRGRPGEAAEEFLAAAPCAADSVLAALALRNAGRSLLDAGDAEGAKRALWESLNFAGDAADLARVNDWIDRCSWMATALAPKR